MPHSCITFQIILYLLESKENVFPPQSEWGWAGSWGWAAGGSRHGGQEVGGMGCRREQGMGEAGSDRAGTGTEGQVAGGQMAGMRGQAQTWGGQQQGSKG